jgi:hypothetical protein
MVGPKSVSSRAPRRSLKKSALRQDCPAYVALMDDANNQRPVRLLVVKNNVMCVFMPPSSVLRRGGGRRGRPFKKRKFWSGDANIEGGAPCPIH